MLLLFAILFFLFFLATEFLLCFENCRIKRQYFNTFFFIFAIAMGIIAFYFEPKETSPDLYRHLWWTRRFIDRDPIQLVLFYDNLKHGLIVWNLFILIADRLGNEHFLPAIAVFFNYLFYFLSCSLCIKHLKVRRLYLGLFFITKFGLVTIFQVFSGLRNSLAFSILAYLLLYIAFIPKASKTKIFFLFLFAFFIHSSSIIGILFIFSYKYYKKFKFLINPLFLCWSLFSFIIIKILQMIHIPWFSFFASQMQSYYFLFNADFRIFIVEIFYLLYIFIKILLYGRKMEAINTDGYISLFKLIVYFTFGSILFPTLIARMIYLIGFLSLPMLVKESKVFTKAGNILNIFITCIFTLLMGAYNTNAMFSHIGLNI